MPVERREWAIAIASGQPATGGTQCAMEGGNQALRPKRLELLREVLPDLRRLAVIGKERARVLCRITLGCKHMPAESTEIDAHKSHVRGRLAAITSHFPHDAPVSELAYRFARNDDVARQGSDMRQCLRSARPDVYRARPSQAQCECVPHYNSWRMSKEFGAGAIESPLVRRARRRCSPAPE
jgi:hypothetical protein